MSMIRQSLTFTACALLIARSTLGGQAAAPAASPSPDYAQEAYVIEQSRTTLRFENDGTGRRDLYLRVKVQSESGVQAWGQLAFPYTSANERMDVAFVRVLKTDGTVVTASADAVQDLSSAVQREAPVYTDTRENRRICGSRRRLLRPVGQQVGRAAVEGVVFISGDEALRRFGDALRTATFDATFPDSAPAKLLRRGTLSCASADRSGSCRFVMMLPADAQAAQREDGAR